ncbi:MAG: 30S ribosomal protein THX [Flavobacteriales bacterium]|jgi:ribosomal small subunit protein bTHX
MGKGDKKTAKGKRVMGSYGNARKRKVKKVEAVVKAKTTKPKAEKAVTEKKTTAKKAAAPKKETTAKKTTAKKAKPEDQ